MPGVIIDRGVDTPQAPPALTLQESTASVMTGDAVDHSQLWLGDSANAMIEVAMSFSEREWKALRQLEPVALERFCARVLQECVSIIDGTAGTSHERYLELYTLLRERDEELAGAFNDMRRSRAVARLAAKRRLGVVTDQEMDAFSRETRDTVAALLDL